MPRLSLALMAPLCLILLYLSLVGAEFYYEKSLKQEQVAEAQLAQVRQQMFRLQHIVSEAMAVQDTDRIAQEVSLAATDLELMVLVLVDPGSNIRYANHLVWQGSRASQVIDGYEPSRHQQTVAAQKPWVQVNPDRLSIQAYYPVNHSGVPRYSEINLIYLEYDLSGAYSRAISELQQRFLQIWGGGALLILMFLTVFHYVGVRPLRSLLRLARLKQAEPLAQTVPMASSEVAKLQQYMYQTELKLKRTLKQLRDSEQRWLFAVEGSQTGIWDWQISSGELFLSDRWKEMLGYGPTELKNEYSSWESRLHPDDKARVLERLQSYLKGEADVYESRHRLKHRQGHYIWVLDRGMVVEWEEDGRAARVIGSQRDVSEDVRNQQAIAHQANHDSLTNLANRRAVMDALFEFQQAGPGSMLRLGALLLIDLDNFKLVNDALGHHHGDRLLIQAAARLSGFFSGNALVARLGGDEFAIMVLDLATDIEQAAHQAMQLGAELKQQIARSFQLSDQQINVTASVGVCLFDNHHPVEPAQLLKRADMAMYAAKDGGRNGCALYSDELEDKATENLWLQNELRHAIEREQLSLVFQPIFNHDGELVCCEALCRWHHPERGPISPAQFIPVAEDSGLIIGIGQWVLLEVCRTLKAMAEKGTPMPAVAVNISARHFNQSDFVERLLALLKAHQVSPEQIELELTEYALLSNLNAISERMQRLRSAGFSIAIDDFGTGYSSLSYLQSLPLSRLKLDAAFVGRIGTEAGNAIVRAIVEMAHSLMLKVVAEGVETEAQQAYLSSLDCDFFQGYLLGKPMPASELVTRRIAPSVHSANRRG
ncbi:putative bifunctional diguanylate cyclase/phosphodiesterase [Shewanella zhangzhouensis]|uniref:putative bifunctional diguanylate cyclase/phosphodiesterase n=1 Tax=Shewanella zhangzhouensis TaxID=2864213 RepID=UPI0021ACBA45|nr:GGDEF and EAL domain-containing protein [Shewanella zhangzhouensis]